MQYVKKKKIFFFIYRKAHRQKRKTHLALNKTQQFLEALVKHVLIAHPTQGINLLRLLNKNKKKAIKIALTNEFLPIIIINEHFIWHYIL